MATLPSIETRSPLGSSYFERLISDNVSKLELLPDPAIIRASDFNAAQELIIYKIRKLSKDILGTLASGFTLTITAGSPNAVSVKAGTILYEDFIYELSSDLNTGVTSLSGSASNTYNCYLRITNTRTTSDDDPTDTQFVSTDGTTYDIHNEYRSVFDFIFQSVETAAPTDTDDGIDQVRYLLLGTVGTVGTEPTTATSVIGLTDTLNGLIQNRTMPDVSYTSKFTYRRKPLGYQLGTATTSVLGPNLAITLPDTGNIFTVNNTAGVSIEELNTAVTYIAEMVIWIQFQNATTLINNADHFDIGANVAVAAGNWVCLVFRGYSDVINKKGIWNLISINSVSSAIPTGTIIAWSGVYTSNFDSTGLGTSTQLLGWAICNGNNGTQDLRSRTIIGATDGPASGAPSYSGSSFVNATTGGSETHTLSVAELPAHSHSIQQQGGFDVVGLAVTGNDTNSSAGDATAGEPDVFNPRDIVIENTGSGSAHNIMQPYMALVYLQKII